MRIAVKTNYGTSLVEQKKNLRIITKFNIAGRYDEIKFAFYKKCTKNYTEKYFNISKELILWLKEQYPKK